jgi:hypothetical protein
MTTIFYRDGGAIAAEQVRDELREGAADAGVPQDMADHLFAGALAGDACDCEMLENLIPEFECIVETGFGHPA